MIVYLNNKQFEISKTKTIAEIIEEDLNLANAKGVAIAVNQEVIPKVNWPKHQIKENDKVTIIKATQGG